MPGRRHGKPRFLITYLNRWVGKKLGDEPPREEPLYANYPVSPDGSYVLDNGIIYVSNGTPRQCLIHPGKAGVGPWHVVWYNGFATHSYEGRTLFDDSLEWYFDRVGNDYRITPMTYHRIRRVEDIPALGETFVSATRAARLSDLDDRGRGLIYPWRNQNYVTSGPQIDKFGVIFADDRPDNYLVIREQEWKLFFGASSEHGLAEIEVMDGTRTLRRFAANGKKQFEGVLTGHHDRQYYLSIRVRDQRGGLAVSGPQIVHGWRHFYGMSGADLISCNDSTFQVGSNGKLDFAWCTGGVLAGGTQIGPRLNVQHGEITPIGRDAHSPRVNGRVGVMVDTNRGSEASLNRLQFQFASEECTVLDQMHEHHAEPEVSPTPNHIARARVRWHSFTPRLYDWNFLLVETDVEFLRDATLKEGPGGRHPRLTTLSYHPNEIAAMDHYAYRDADGKTTRQTWNAAGDPTERSPFQHLALGKGGYVGLYPGLTAALVVYTLAGHATASIVDGQLRLGVGKGGEKFRKGDRRSFRYLVGLKFSMPGPEEFERVRRIYGLDGSRPSYSVTLEHGEVQSTQYVLRLRGEEGWVDAHIGASPDMPSDLPLMLEGVRDRWTVSLYDRDSGTIKRVGARDGVAYSAIDLNVGDRRVFFGHPFVCNDEALFSRSRVYRVLSPARPRWRRWICTTRRSKNWSLSCEARSLGAR